MKALCKFQGLLALWPLVLTIIALPDTARARTDDPDDSPLFARSMRNVFEDMAARDRTQLTLREPMVGSVIVVEGGKWAYAAAGEARALVPGRFSAGTETKRRTGPIPLDVTVSDLTCFPTCGASCFPTCTVGGSCSGTCVPQVTVCVYSTCVAPNPTCSSAQPTCYGVSCSVPGVTCVGTLTCGYEISCGNTCTAETCPANIESVSVPQPGQIQLSFWASPYLTYTLQYSTNLTDSVWTGVNTVTGANAIISVSHTNAAPRSFYRLWVQRM